MEWNINLREISIEFYNIFTVRDFNKCLTNKKISIKSAAIPKCFYGGKEIKRAFQVRGE